MRRFKGTDLIDVKQIRDVLGRLEAVEAALGDPDVLQDRRRYRATLGDHAFLKRLESAFSKYEKALHDLAGKEQVQHILDIELSSTGQMMDDVRLAVEGQKPISYLGHAGGVMPTVEEIADAVRKALKKEVK